MRLWKLIRSFNIKQLWSLSVLCAGHLGRIWPSWKATKKSVAYANKYYGKLHQQNNQANAFRHAVWNYLIAKNCTKDPARLDSVLNWTNKITALHEDLFPNDPTARAMDLHNNKVGREIYKKYLDKTEEEVVMILRTMTASSLLVSDEQEIVTASSDHYVHMTNMPDYEG